MAIESSSAVPTTAPAQVPDPTGGEGAPSSRADALPAATRMDRLDLRVADLPAMLRFYVDGIGLFPLAEENGAVVLGLGSAPVISLTHSPDLRPSSRRGAGLFHTAILFDDEPALAAAMLSMMRQFPQHYTGSADHLVSQAFYFEDPEGNGVELYADRPRSQWQWNGGHVKMATLPLDVVDFVRRHLTPQGAALLDDEGVGALNLPGTLGHVHLQVGDVASARAFYVDALGFDETSVYGDQALFVSAGGYHHHMAMNTWNSRGAGPRAKTLGLGQVEILVPSLEDVERVRERVTDHGIATQFDGARLALRDPWENEIALMAG